MDTSPKSNDPGISLDRLPVDTEMLREGLRLYLDSTFEVDGMKLKVGQFRVGVYAFYDYDGEPIYVGQTAEKLSTRIRRHLTNQRTDAVAMSVLDPYEVCDIEVWPLVKFQSKLAANRLAETESLNALEYEIYHSATNHSQFKAVLNEKNPPTPKARLASLPSSFRKAIVPADIKHIRSHPDTRIARRAATIARLSQVIAERRVQGGLRRVLVVQASRLQRLASRRFEALGGEGMVESETTGDD